MDEAVFLTSMAMFTILAGLCSIVFNKLKLPPLIGYLVSGIILANLWDIPEGGHTTVEILSDMGLVMLMFCIGLEINLKKIRKQGLFAMEVAIIQLPLMVLGGFIAGTFLGFNTVQCITLGAIISGSSTAVVMAVLKSQGKLDKEHIEMLVLITIMEDIGQVIILSMITPLLAGSSLDTSELVVMIVSIVVFMLVSIVVGLRLVPRVINWVSDNVSSEVLVVFSIGLAFGMALLSTYIGLSMAIGAFLMGMIVAASRKSKEINHDIEPMKNLFMAMFFISIGMEISLGTLYENITLIVIIYLLFAALKTSTVFLAYWIGNERAHTGFVSAIGLCAMGEFAFIIAKEALDMGVVSDSFYTSVIGAALISMIMLPLLTRASDGIWNTASEKCPQGLMDVFMRANDSRDNLYRRLMATSRKSRKSLRRNLTYAYMDIMLIVVVEIAFYFGLPYASDWLLGSFGGTAFMWDLILLIVNFLALSLPTYYLVNNAKYLDELVIAGAKLVTRREGLVDEPGRAYQKFLDFNTYMMVLTIDLAILIIVPNPLDSWFYILIFAAIALILVLVIYRKPWEKHNDDHEDDYDELVPAEGATDDEGAVQNTVSIKLDDTGK